MIFGVGSDSRVTGFSVPSMSSTTAALLWSVSRPAPCSNITWMNLSRTATAHSPSPAWAFVFCSVTSASTFAFRKRSTDAFRELIPSRRTRIFII